MTATRQPRELFYILASDGETPIAVADVQEWARWFADIGQRRLAWDEIDVGTEPVTVSTVFLGVDQQYGRRRAPVLWETMVFGGDLDQEQQRYTSAHEARAGHAAIVERITRRATESEQTHQRNLNTITNGFRAAARAIDALKGPTP